MATSYPPRDRCSLRQPGSEWSLETTCASLTGNGSAQLKMAGAFYAMGTIVSRKQNQIAGTFVGSYFDMGTNVPNIYQVPSLVYNMPPAMPGDNNIFALRTRSWRERAVTN